MTASAQELVKEVKKLIDATTSDRDALTEAAQMIAKTVSRLSEEVKEAASALTSENQTGQVHITFVALGIRNSNFILIGSYSEQCERYCCFDE